MDKDKLVNYLNEQIKNWEEAQKDAKDDYEYGYADAAVSVLSIMLGEVQEGTFDNK